MIMFFSGGITGGACFPERFGMPVMLSFAGNVNKSKGPDARTRRYLSNRKKVKK